MCFLVDIIGTFLMFLLPDTILGLLRLPSKLVSPTALQALGCFLVQLLADCATSSSGGTKTEKLYNDFDFQSLKKRCLVLKTQQFFEHHFLKSIKTAKNHPTMDISAEKCIQDVFS